MSDCCSICVEKYNKTNHRKIQCVHCDGVYCKKCMETYMLNDSSDPKCMMCQHELSNDFILENMTSFFINNIFKKHRETILMDREKCLMPYTQEHVKYEIKIKNMSNEVKTEEDEIKKIKQEMIELNNATSQKIKKMKQKIIELNNSVSQKNMRISRWWLTHEIETDNKHESSSSSSSSKFIQCCPVENCKGFLSTQWKCGICEVKVCNRCNNIRSDDHKCNEDDVKTIEMLKKDTKPCPSCGCMIHKIHGCDQMWCVQCKTPFSWKNGKIEKGIVHNPHYYEWQRQTNNGVAPRVPGDIQDGCLDMRYYDVVNMRRHLRSIFEDTTQCSNALRTITTYQQLINHTKHYEIRRYVTNDNIEKANLDLRIKYMLNELDENKWKVLLQQREKKRKKNIEIHQIMDMFVNVGSDLFKNIFMQCKTQLHIKNSCLELDALIKHVNKSFLKIKEKYNNKVPYIVISSENEFEFYVYDFR